MVIKNWVFLFLILLVLFVGFSSASPSPPAKIVSGIVSNVASALFKWLLSLKPPTKTVVPSRSMVKFEGGYSVETVFDGSKLGIEPYSVGMSPSGELLVLDSQNSNIHKISSLPLSRYSRPKLIAGSPEGYSGHVDGKLREARMNNPKGFTVDDSGNIYVADTMNMAIRKISDAGIVTIAGGNWGRGGGHVDGPSEDAKFSNDFDVLYVGSSCSLLVVDRGNQAIREIQLHDDDCSDYQHDGDLHLGIAVLAVAVFFGYMLALLQRRVATMFLSTNDPTPRMNGNRPAPYQRPIKSVRPPLIPPEYDPEREEEGIFVSVGKLFASTGAMIGEMFGGIFSGFRKKPMHHYPLHFQQNAYQQQQPQYPIDAWPMQESFMIPHDDEPPPPQARDPNMRRSYPLMTSKDPEKPRHFKQSRYFYSEQSGEYFNQQQLNQQHQQHHQRHYSSGPQTCYEQSCETSEIIFGAVQEQVDGKQGTVVIKAVDYGNPVYSNQNRRSRHNYAGYAYGY